MKAAAWMMAGGVMVTAGCSMVSRDGAASCDASGACASPEAAACAAGAVQLAPSAHPDSRNWRSLFNLDLGNAVFTPGVWFYNEKGDLTASKDEAIWTDRDYENFMLDVEYRCDPAANSGVLIYCSDMANWIPNAVEVQILDDNHPHWAKEQPFARNGGLYGHLAPKVNNVKPAGEWNRMTITAQGKRVQVRVNEEITVDADLSAWTSATKNPDGSDIPPWLSRPWAELPTRGRIGLQGKHGNAAIFFRNVRIKEL